MNTWYIIFIIGYPLVILTLLIIAHKKWKIFKLDHHNLFKQKLFWLSIIIPFVTFIAFGLWTWWGKTPALNAKGFENFLAISKLPLLFLAASVPLASIVNNIHRTIQTEKQIGEAEKKNLSDAYYTHFKHTLELFKDISSESFDFGDENAKITLSFNNPISLYHKNFPENTPTENVSYIPDMDFIRIIIINWQIINRSLRISWTIAHQIENDIHHKFHKQLALIHLYNIEHSIEVIIKKLSLANLTIKNRPSFECESFVYRGLCAAPTLLNNMLRELGNMCSKYLDITVPSRTDLLDSVRAERRFIMPYLQMGYKRGAHYRDSSDVLLRKKNGDKLATYFPNPYKKVQRNTKENNLIH